MDDTNKKEVKQNKKIPPSKNARLFVVSLVSMIIAVVLLIFSTLAWFSGADPSTWFHNRVISVVDVDVRLFHFQRIDAIERYGADTVLTPEFLIVPLSDAGHPSDPYYYIDDSFYERPSAGGFQLPLWPGVSDFLMIIIEDNRNPDNYTNVPQSEIPLANIRVTLRGISWNDDLDTLDNDYREDLSALLTVNVLSPYGNNRRFSTIYDQIKMSDYYEEEVEQHLLYDWDRYQGDVGSLMIIGQNLYLRPGEIRQVFFYYSFDEAARYPIMEHGRPLITIERITFNASLIR